jgi:hypothetical protein
LIGLIEDATDVGFSSYANDKGEAFFSLPYGHWAHDYIAPLNTHMEVQRQASPSSAWVTVGWALVSECDSTQNDTVYYGDDYLTLFSTSISGLATTYTAIACDQIIQWEALLAIKQNGLSGTAGGLGATDPNSRLGFLTTGTIEATATTATVVSDFQSRLDLMRGVVQIQQQGTTTRPMIYVSRTGPPFTFNFALNKGAEKPGLVAEWGGLINGFRLRGGYGQIATAVYGIAQRRGGATIMYAYNEAVPPATYGIIQRPVVYAVLPDQATFNKIVASEGKRTSQINRDLAVVFRSNNGLGPFEGYEVGDSVPVTIKRGKVSLLQAYYTIWGIEWVGHRDGSESTSLVLLPEAGGLTVSSAIVQPETVTASAPPPASQRTRTPIASVISQPRPAQPIPVPGSTTKVV